MWVFRCLRYIAALMCLFFCSSNSYAQTLPFSTVNTVPLNTMLTKGVFFGEADGDGIPDFFANSGFFGFASGVDAYLADSSGNRRGGKWITGPPAAPLAPVIRSDLRDINWDGLSDVAFATSDGSVDVYVSTGKPTQPYTLAASFDLTQTYPAASFWETHLIGGLVFADVNNDGFFDLLVGGSVTDMWSGLSTPIPCQYAMGTGMGTFGPLQAATVPAGYTPGGAILSKWIDADPSMSGNDTVVFITEQIYHPSQVTYPGTASFIETLRYVGGSLVYQGVGPSGFPSGIRPTSYAVADLNNDNIPEVAFGGFYGYGNSQWGAVEVFEGTAAGVTTATTFQLALIGPGSMPSPNQVVDLEIVDLDHDELKDVVAALGYGMSPPAQDAELYRWEQQLPNSFNFQYYPDVMTLPGRLPVDGEQYIVTYGPNRPNPGILEFPNFDRNPYPDLAVAGLYQTLSSTSQTIVMVTAMNDTVSVANDEYWAVEFGTGSMASEGRVPRTGTFGGSPHIDNPNWGINLTNAPSGHAVMGHAGLVAVNIPIGDWVMPAYFDPLYNSPFFITGGNSPGEGKASIPLVIPNNPSLVGQDFYFTFSVLDQARPNFPFAFADPIYVRTGAK